jgi:hypothetical protein
MRRCPAFHLIRVTLFEFSPVAGGGTDQFVHPAPGLGQFVPQHEDFGLVRLGVGAGCGELLDDRWAAVVGVAALPLAVWQWSVPVPSTVANMTSMYVAAGGGGDVVAAMMLDSARGAGARPVVATYAWDRLLIDPLPGPRSVSDFYGLEQIAPGVWQVTGSTRPVPPAGSLLPRLAAELPATVLLLDPYRGAIGLRRQLIAAAELFAPSSMTLVDVGGDVVAEGHEPELKSPIADCLALATCADLPLPVDVTVLGAGLDGELPREYVIDRISAFGGGPSVLLGSQHVESVLGVFRWHPSEASGILAAAAFGVRGAVEVRDSGTRIEISDHSAMAFTIGAKTLAEASPMASRLAVTRDLDQAEAVVMSVCGRSELAVERTKAAGLRTSEPTVPDIQELRRRVAAFEQAAAARGSDFVTIRRLAEAVGAPRGAGYEAWRADLIAERPHRYCPPLWAVGPPVSLEKA